MGSLFTTLINSANALGVYSQALNVVSNNVTNANTPGYAKQSVALTAQPFDVTVGLPGGVTLAGVQSARNPYAEQYVRSEQSAVNYAQQKTSNLSQLSGLFDVTGKSGVGPAIDSLFSSFSQLSVSPNDAGLRQNVLNQASSLAQQFQVTSSGLAQASSQVTNESRSTVATINAIATTIAQLNGSHLKDFKGSVDAGLDAQLNSNLEELSKYVNYSSLQQPDGSVTLYVGGRTPLVVGDQANAIQGDFSAPQARILDSQGNDITSQITQGQLAATLEVQNTKIPGYQADLNTLAQTVADNVNNTLSNGIDQNGASPVNNLFTYDAAAGAGRTLALNPAFTPDQIAAALPGSAGGNDNALALSALGTAKPLNGFTLTGYYGDLASRLGQDISVAQSSQDAQTQTLTQAQNLRAQDSGVSLDQEAETLVQFQRAYQATSKLISVLNDLTNSALNLIPGG